MEHSNLHEGSRRFSLGLLIMQSVMVLFMIMALALLFGIYRNTSSATNATSSVTVDDSLQEDISLKDRVLPKDGVTIPVVWGDVGARMAEAGVIDASHFEELHMQRGIFGADGEELLYGNTDEYMVINQENAGLLLNLFWALGLANKNEILEGGPMVDERYGGDPSRFASTAGWTLAEGGPMSHYSRHSFVTLTNEQQAQVENVSKGIHRPCCGNSTYFPDCNHGMAMLGLLQLLAQEDISEDEMYEIALTVNSYWFPDQHVKLAEYFEQNGTNWGDVNPEIALSSNYSSGEGYQRVLGKLDSSTQQAGSSCGV